MAFFIYNKYEKLKAFSAHNFDSNVQNFSVKGTFITESVFDKIWWSQTLNRILVCLRLVLLP